MTATALVADLRARGVELRMEGSRLRYRPVERVTVDELDTLRGHKAEVLALLRAEQQSVNGRPIGSGADDVPSDPCGLCGHQPMSEMPDWPLAGSASWVCLACATRPVPSLEAVYASLSVDERGRLLNEARAGDPLARLLLTLVTVSGAA